MTTMRPGCVLLQALACGGFHPDLPLSIIASEHWVVSPSKDMRVIMATKEEWEDYATVLDEMMKEKSNER